MRTPAVVLLLCWSTIALALGDPSSPRGRIIPPLLQDKHALVPGLSQGEGATLQSAVRGTNSRGYDPWAVQVTGLSSGEGVWVIHAVDDSTAWAIVGDATALQWNAVIRTTNGGTTWSRHGINGLPATFRFAGLCALDGSVCWVVMFDASGTSGGGIFHTTNGGVTWTQDPNAFKTAGGFADFIRFFDANNGVCVGDPTDGYFEIYTTSDGGASWSRVPQANIPPIHSDETGMASQFYAAGNSLWFPTFVGSGTGRYYRTSDKGLTWSVHDYPGILPRRYPILAFRDDYVGLGSGGWGEVSRTTDGGSTWSRISSPAHFTLIWLKHVPGTSDMYVGQASLECPGLEGEFMDGTTYTVDGGVTWTMARELNGYPNLDFASGSAGWSGGFDPNIGKWTMAQGRVIGASVDTLNFHMLELGQVGDTVIVNAVNFGSESVTLSGIVAPGPNFTVAGQPSFPATLPPLGSARFELRFTPQAQGALVDSLLILSDATNAPMIDVQLTGMAYQFNPPLPGHIYASATSLYTFSLANLTASSVGSFGGPTIQGLSVGPVDSVLYGISGGSPTSTLYKIDPILVITKPVVSVKAAAMRAIAFSKSGTLFAGTRTGRLLRVNIDTGDTTVIGTDPGKVYNSFAFSPTNGMLYASVYPTSGAQRDTLYTVDTLTGKATPVGRTGDGAVTLAIAFDADGTLYGLKGTGATTNTLIRINVADGRGTEIGSLGTAGLLAITMLDLATAIEESPAREIPAAYELLQNYPNPFNPSTTIRYALPSRSHVTLTVFNTLGQKVATLVDEIVDAGHQSVEFDASGLASGVYLYRLQAGDFVFVKKLVVLK